MTLLFLLGTWPIATFLLTALFFTVRYGIKQSKSGSTTGGGFNDPVRRWKENVPFYKTQGGVFSLILAAVTLAYFIWLATSK